MLEAGGRNMTRFSTFNGDIDAFMVSKGSDGNITHAVSADVQGTVWPPDPAGFGAVATGIELSSLIQTVAVLSIPQPAPSDTALFTLRVVGVATEVIELSIYPFDLSGSLTTPQSLTLTAAAEELAIGRWIHPAPQGIGYDPALPDTSVVGFSSVYYVLAKATTIVGGTGPLISAQPGAFMVSSEILGSLPSSTTPFELVNSA